jgi:hypothetical protein
MNAFEDSPLSDREAAILADLADLLDKLVKRNRKEVEDFAAHEKEVRAKSFSGFLPLLIAYSNIALSRLFGSHRAEALTSTLFARCKRPRDRAAGWRILQPWANKHRQAFAYFVERGAIHVGIPAEEHTLSDDEIVRDFTVAQEAGISPVEKAVADAHAEMNVEFIPVGAVGRYPTTPELWAAGITPARTSLGFVVGLRACLIPCAATSIEAIDQLVLKHTAGTATLRTPRNANATTTTDNNHQATNRGDGQAD